MRHYELMVILSPEVDERTVAPSLQKLLENVMGEEGTLDNLDLWGKRTLAYPIAKKTEGIYVVIDMNTTPAHAAEIDRQLNLNETIMRTKLVRKDA